MPAPSPLAQRVILFIGDTLAVVIGVAAALFIRHGGWPEETLLELYAIATPFLALLWAFGLLTFGLYDIALAKNDRRFFERMSRAVAFNGLVAFLIFHLVSEFRLTPRATMAIIFAATSGLLFSWRTLANAVLARTAKDRILFLGLNEEVYALVDHLRANPQLGYEAVLGIPTAAGADHGAGEPSRLPLRPLPADGLGPLIRQEGIHTIVTLVSPAADMNAVKIIFDAIPLGVTVVELPSFFELIFGKIPTSLIGEAWFLENLGGSRRPHYEFLKRILDLTAAVLMSAVVLLIFPFAAAAIILSTPGDILRYKNRRAHTGDGMVFFRQKRIGQHGLPFGFIKFRSQILGAQKLGWEKGAGPDPRAYPVGTFLRKTYLDELPQVWNVIKGEMSFVGPRPERPEFVRVLEREIPFYRIRELVLPGITGWAQLNMQNDASVSDAPEKLCYDLYYIKNRSLFLDAMILVKTALKLLQRSGR